MTRDTQVTKNSALSMAFQDENPERNRLFFEIIERLNYLLGMLGNVSGVDSDLVTGTAGTSGTLVEWDSSGDLVGSSGHGSTHETGGSDALTALAAAIINITDTNGVLTATEVESALAEIAENRTVAMAALDIDWSTGEHFTKSISSNSVFTISNPVKGRVACLELTVSNTPTITLPTGSTVIAGSYDDTVVNYIWFYCSNASSPAFQVTISQEQT